MSPLLFVFKPCLRAGFASVVIFVGSWAFSGCPGSKVAEREVVITGVGIVSPIGVGREAVWNAIESRQSGVRPISELASAGWIAPFGGEITDFDPKELIQPR